MVPSITTMPIVVAAPPTDEEWEVVPVEIIVIPVTSPLVVPAVTNPTGEVVAVTPST
jgi:hypothetical protein